MFPNFGPKYRHYLGVMVPVSTRRTSGCPLGRVTSHYALGRRFLVLSLKHAMVEDMDFDGVCSLGRPCAPIRGSGKKVEVGSRKGLRELCRFATEPFDVKYFTSYLVGSRIYGLTR